MEYTIHGKMILWTLLLALIVVMGVPDMKRQDFSYAAELDTTTPKAVETGTTGIEAAEIDATGIETEEIGEAAQEDAPAIADTSVIWPMHDKLARQLGVSEAQKTNPLNDYKYLKTPAQITRQGDFYFIVDTYNNQILYSSDMWKPMNEWRVLDRNLRRPHAIASDGQMYLAVDTDNDRVLCYEYIRGGFQNTQRFDDIGKRPHYIQYDAATESFFVWSSLTGDMYIIQKMPGYDNLCLKEIRHIYELDGFYVRSFSIEGDEILFPSGNNCYMIAADKQTLRVKERYAVVPEISGMAAVRKIGSYYYMTVSTDEKLSHEAACMIRTTDLHSLAEGLYENVTPLFQDMKVPYYMERINGTYYVTSHEGKKSVYRFQVVEDRVVNVGSMY